MDTGYPRNDNQVFYEEYLKGGEMIKCPKCGSELKVSIPRESATDCEDIEFKCQEEHLYFIRVKADDLIDEND